VICKCGKISIRVTINIKGDNFKIVKDKQYYKEPPLKEVICRIDFPTNQNIHSHKDDLAQLLSKHDFPIFKEQTERQLKFKFENNETSHIFTDTPVLLFSRRDEKTFIRLTESTVYLYRLTPYEKWCDLEPHLNLIEQELFKSVDIKDITSRGLQYVNVIEIENTANPTKIDEYFKFYPSINGKALNSRSFTIGNEEYIEGLGSLSQNLRSEKTSKEELSEYLFELRILNNETLTLESNNKKSMKSWFDSAHNEIVNRFEISITDKLRKIWGPYNAKVNK